MKKPISLLLSIIMLLSITAGLGISAYAETDDSEVTEEYLQYMLDLIPDEMSLDIPEVEYEKAAQLVENNAREIWKNNGIDLTGIDVRAFGPVLYEDNFYQVEIGLLHSETTGYAKSAEINIKYNNSSDYNSEDEQWVKGLEIEVQRYYEVSVDYLQFDDTWDYCFQVMADYHTQLINDSSITFKATTGAGGSDHLLLDASEGVSLAVFKNGILYDIIRPHTSVYFVPVVTVPNSIDESDVNDYAINILEENFSFITDIVSITKGAVLTHKLDSEVIWTKEITDGYTVKIDGDYESYVIIRREADTNTTVADDAIIEEGTDEVYVIGSGSGASIHCTYPLDEFVSVMINSELVDEANYILSEGSTILTFTSEYLDTLVAGDYEVTLNFTSGSVLTNLTIEKAVIDEPETENQATEPITEATTEAAETTTEKTETTRPITTEKDDTEKSPSTGAESKGLFALAAIALAGGAVMIVKKKEQD